MDLKTLMEQKLGKVPTPTVIDLDKLRTVPNRRDRRRLDRAERAEQARQLEGARTAAAKLKAYLQQFNTIQLSGEVLTPNLIERVADCFPTIWDLSQAERADLLNITGMGPARVRALQLYLESNKVAVKWGRNGN